MVYVFLTLLGLCFGSFVNALVWRLHEQEKLTADSKQLTASTKDKRQKTKDLSIVQGRSMCPNCQQALAWYDLIPIISWLQLQGKCRYCHQPISLQYPLVELVTALLFVFSYIYWPYGLNWQGMVLFGLWLVFITIFMALTVFDLRWMLLPDRLTLPLQGLAVGYVLIHALLANTHVHILVQAFWGLLFLAGTFYILFQLSKGKWIGGGDIKLAVTLGLLVGGPIEALLVIFMASGFGSLYSIPLLLRKKINRRIPFGPFLILATIIVFLFGADLIAWYRHQLLLV